VVLNIDSKFAISLCKNPVHHDRSKHIDMKYHYIRECVEESKIEDNYVCTDDQLADILTKFLGRLKFLEMRERISVQAVKTGTSCLGGVIVRHNHISDRRYGVMCQVVPSTSRICACIRVGVGIGL
jgi:hypothetical protein